MAIVKRKIGNEEFYYLQHTYRKNKKPVTLSKYLGKELPSQKKIEKYKQELVLVQKQELYKKLESIKEKFQKNWQKVPESVKEQELHEIAIVFTYNTNAIEGSTITLEDTREIIEQRTAPKKSMRDIKETENHAKVFLHMIRDSVPLTIPLLLQWHNQLF